MTARFRIIQFVGYFFRAAIDDCMVNQKNKPVNKEAACC